MSARGDWRLALVAAVFLSLPVSGSTHASAAVPGSETTGRVVVAFEPGAASAAEHSAERAGARVDHRAPGSSFVVVTPGDGESPSALARRLGGAKGVRYAEPEYVVRALFTPNDPRFGAQWNLSRIGAQTAWDVERGDPGVTIAVLDSGVDLQHPDLAGRLDTSIDYDFVSDDTYADDDYGHGTHVAGVIAAASDNLRDVAGIAHGCTLLPVRVLDGRGAGTDTDVAEGIRYAVDRGASIINLSLGTQVAARVLEDAVDYAVANDVVVVAAAGNLGTEGLQYPAAYPDVIAVGATQRDNDLAPVSQHGSELDVVAPGINVISLRPVTGPAAGLPTGMLSGTSVAAPHATGVAALVRSEHPTWTAAVVAERLTATAEDLGDAGWDRWFGAGLVRADRAVAAGDPPSDDGFPGLPVNLSPIAGSVSSDSDQHDVFSFPLSGGQSLLVGFTASANATMTVSLLGPRALSIDATPLASVVSTGTRATLEYIAPPGLAGTHRLVVTAAQGAGAYSLDWRRCYPTSVTAWAPATCAWGSGVTVGGRAYSRGERLAGARVVLDVRSTTSQRWVTGYAAQTTVEDGSYRFSVRPGRRLYYRVRFAGTRNQLPSVSRAVPVSPKARLLLREPTVTVRGGRPFAVTGTLVPERPAVPAPVEIDVSLWDADDRSWIAYRTYTTVCSREDGHTRFVRYLTLPRGTWRIRAKAAGTHLYDTTYASRRIIAQ